MQPEEKPIWVYIAGPYSSGPVQGVRNAILAGEMVYAAGAIPIVPHDNLLWDLVSPHPAEFYYAYDLKLLARCDALLRLPGESVGADAEVAEAGRLGLPVYLADYPDHFPAFADFLSQARNGSWRAVYTAQRGGY